MRRTRAAEAREAIRLTVAFVLLLDAADVGEGAHGQLVVGPSRRRKRHVALDAPLEFDLAHARGRAGAVYLEIICFNY